MDNRIIALLSFPAIRFWTAFKYRDIKKEKKVDAKECTVFFNDIHKHFLQFFMFSNTCYVAEINGKVTKT